MSSPVSPAQVGGESVKGVSAAALKALGPFTHAVVTLREGAKDIAVPLANIITKLLKDLKFAEYIQVSSQPECVFACVCVCGCALACSALSRCQNSLEIVSF